MTGKASNRDRNETVPGAPDSGSMGDRECTVCTPTSSSIEKTVVALFQSLLGIKTVSPNDNLIWLGADSLLAGQVVSRLRDIYGVELSLETVFTGSAAELVLEVA